MSSAEDAARQWFLGGVGVFDSMRMILSDCLTVLVGVFDSMKMQQGSGFLEV